MTVTKRKQELCEEFWAAYFGQLDALAPHDSGTAAERYTSVRGITCFACKDGALFTFEPSAALSFAHKRTTGSVEATLFRLTQETLGGLGFNPFPDHDDITLAGTDVGPGETKQLSTVFDRVVWFRGRATMVMTEAEAKRMAGSDHVHQMNSGVISAPKPPTGGHDRKPN